MRCTMSRRSLVLLLLDMMDCYFAIDSQILWIVVSVEIPSLKTPLQEFLNVYNPQGGNL